MKLTTFTAVFGTVVSPVVGAAVIVSPNVNAACNNNQNNLERCFQASPALAVPYCSSFLNVPVVTVTSTTTPRAYLTLPQTVSTEIDVVTSTTLSTSISVSTSTTTATIYSTTTILAPGVAVQILPAKAKRNPKAPKPSPSTLACLTAVNAKSFTASVSSACQCLAITPLTVSVTATAATATSTNFVPVTVTTFTTTIIQIVTVLPQTSIVTAQETDVITTTSFTYPPTTSSAAASSSSSSSSTSSTTISRPTCIPNTLITVDGNYFETFFQGTGVREPLDNPATEGVPADVKTFPGSLTDCEAVSACIDFGWTSANNDYTYDIHYLIAEDVWACAGFYQGSNTNYFTIPDSNVGAAYGYNAVS